ncbi:phosphoadenylyl-sulfate reductase [Bacillus massiliglaciei]|uniref:phosphoadenylyl-sulfate reductase n=1 Tax=Bacillus massiliglaciei TaxID=1816693 RepID=UPI000B0AC212|nr:phosphoadenylyl-sulfate reductase [Bacillus massiliglaciei]
MTDLITFENFEKSKLPAFPEESETKGALEVLEWANAHYQDELVYACSFGIEGIVLTDLLAKVNPHAKIVFLDTGLHFEETYQLIEKIKQRYPGLNIEMKKPDMSLEEQAAVHGEELWAKDPNLCCSIRKVTPLNESLSGATAWLSGLRREQSETRALTNYINLDAKFKSIKICPLIHWTWKDVWRYAHKQQLDYNVLHDNGYPSIGCRPCTAQAINPDDLRSGRWKGAQKTECGLHLS